MKAVAKETRARVGAAIAVHDNRELLRRCLEAGAPQWELAVVLDDASTDGTAEMLSRAFPDVVRLAGDGQLWWTGGTNRAIRVCLDSGCAHVLLLNPDVVLEPGAVDALVREVESHREAVAAAVVVDADRPERVWWGGSRWRRRFPLLPIMTQRYLYPAGTLLRDLPSDPYRTDEVHGRGVLVPAAVFDRCGLLDEETFPHYGGDLDFSHRLRRAGVPMWVVPTARARLAVDNSGMTGEGSNRRQRVEATLRYLFQRKHGEAVRVWFRLLRRHAPKGTAIPTFAYVIAVNVVRRLGLASGPGRSRAK